METASLVHERRNGLPVEQGNIDGLNASQELDLITHMLQNRLLLLLGLPSPHNFVVVAIRCL